MLRVLVVVRERMVELRVGQAARVVGAGEGEERGLAAGELEQAGTHSARIPHARGPDVSALES